MLCSITFAAPKRTLDIPVEQHSSSVPIAAQQRYLARAVAAAVAELDLHALEDHDVAVDVAGVLQMSDDALGEFILQEIESHISLAGARVDEDSEDRLIVRVAQAGLDRVLEGRRVEVPRKKGWPIALMAAGSSLATVGVVVAYSDPTWNGVAVPAGVVGTLAAGAGVGLLFLPPKRVEVECEVFRARVTIDTTFVPARGKSKRAHGESDILVDDADAPCDAEAAAVRQHR